MSYLYLVFKFLPQLESATYLSDIRFQNEIQQGIVAKMAANFGIAVINAKAEAEANRIKTLSITPAILEWERLQVEKDRIAAWMAHGVKVPTTLIVGGSGSAMPNLFLKVIL